MNIERRKFLQSLAGACGAGFARNLGLGVASLTAVGGTAAAAAATAPAAATALAAGAYGSGVRAQVFEVIVRQAAAGAPWRQICAGPMQVNNISPAEVEEEVKRRTNLAHCAKPSCLCTPCLRKRVKSNQIYLDKVASIPHSQTAPCACQDCRLAVANVLSKIRQSTQDT